MKIAKAQKHIKRLKGEIAELQQRISSTLSTLEENEYEADYPALMATLKEKVSRLINLKVGVMKANIDNGMFTTILNLGELKSRLNFLGSLNPIVGAVRASYGEGEKAKYKSQLSPAEKMKMVEDCQKAINDMTDRLDDFNLDTSVAEVAIDIVGF